MWIKRTARQLPVSDPPGIQQILDIIDARIASDQNWTYSGAMPDFEAWHKKAVARLQVARNELRAIIEEEPR